MKNILLVSRAPLGSLTGSPIRGVRLAQCLAEQDLYVRTLSPGDCVPFHPRVTHTAASSVEAMRRFILTDGKQFDLLLCLTVWEAGVFLHAGRLASLPCVVDCHGLSIIQSLDASSGGRLDVAGLHRTVADDVAAMRADGILAANSAVCDWCGLAHVPFCDAVGLTSVADFLVPKPKRPASDIRVLYAGSALFWQGVDIFLQAATLVRRQSSDFSFHLLSHIQEDNPLRQSVQALEEAGDLIVEPTVDVARYPAFLADFDIGVIPRRLQPATYQSFPQKLVDYMAGGLCVVATNIYPHPEVFANTGCGVLCPTDPNGMAEAILGLQSHDVRRLMGAKAREYALAHFDMSRQGPKIKDFLEKVSTGSV